MKRNVLFWICIALFSLVVLFSGYMVVSELLEYRKGESTYEDISKYVHFETAPPETQGATEGSQMPTEAPEPLVPVVDFESLCALNPDTVGWIYVPGTNINYPIVQGADNDHYLYRLFDGTQNSSGSIFMDSRNDGTWQDKNTVIHGHNMKNGTMFASVLDYRSQEFYDEHPTGYLLTPEGDYEIVFFAGYVADATEPGENTWQREFESNEEYLNWMRTAATRSSFTSDMIPGVQDRMITLSTCSYEYDEARYVLIGVLKPVEN